MATELMHLESMLIDRINSHFGYGAIAAVRLIQVPIQHPKKKKARNKITVEITNADQERLEKSVAGIEDAPLRDVLLKLGTAVLRQKTATKRE